jgi:hypothetical protein
LLSRASFFTGHCVERVEGVVCASCARRCASRLPRKMRYDDFTAFERCPGVPTPRKTFAKTRGGPSALRRAHPTRPIARHARAMVAVSRRGGGGRARRVGQERRLRVLGLFRDFGVTS